MADAIEKSGITSVTTISSEISTIPMTAIASILFLMDRVRESLNDPEPQL